MSRAPSRRGAAAAVIAKPRGRDLAAHEATFAVDDTLRALERLGRAGRARSRARVVAVTGSVGKTSAKEMLRVALATAGATHASAASYNNHWGVPLTLARLPADAAFAVVEIGMNHAGEITPLVAMVRPHVALVTTIAPVHIEHLGSIEDIADAKAEIFSGARAGRRGDPQSRRAAIRPAGASRARARRADAELRRRRAMRRAPHRRRRGRRRIARPRARARARTRLRARRARRSYG